MLCSSAQCRHAVCLGTATGPTRTPLDVIGHLAVARALDLIDQVAFDADAAPPLATELVVRGSTAKP